MRPVNLIPPEQRRALRGEGPGISLATRALLGVLALAVLAVASLVVISNQVNSKKSEIADLGRKQQAVETVSNALRPYGNFVKLQQTRTSTVAGLARSRFNWERVLRQLSHTVPPNVWITSLSGSVTPTAGSSGGSGGGGGSSAGGNSLRSSVQGPAVSLQGCARSQRDSARMMARMRTLDDVASVTLTRSELPDTEGSGSAGSPGGSAGGTEQACPRYQFDILVAFKAESGAAATAGGQAQPASAGAAGTTGATGPSGTTGSSGSTGSTTPQATTTGGTGQ